MKSKFRFSCIFEMLKITAAKLFTAKINDSQMLQLSRQNMSRQILVRNFFEPEYLPFAKKKLVLVRFEPRPFGVPGVFVTARLSVQDALQNLNS